MEFPLIDGPDPRTRACPASPGLSGLAGSCTGGPFVLLLEVELLEGKYRLQGLTSLCLKHLCSMRYDLELERHIVAICGLTREGACPTTEEMSSSP